jgi:protein associated with RNAse G/E
MKLTDKDKSFLKECGYLDEDMNQIERALKKTIYELDKKISINEALKILGRKEFLTGISRSAFHYSAVRTKNEKVIYFNSIKLFEKIM